MTSRSQVYTALQSYPNATGSFQTIGFDLTKPYSSNGSAQTGWSLDIRVATNVTYDALIYDTYEENQVVRVNPTQILLNGPSDAFPDSELDPGWTTCVYVWSAALKDWNSTNAEQSDIDGTCTNVLSEQCLSDLRANSVSRGQCMAAIGASESCKEFMGVGNGVSSKRLLSRSLHTSLNFAVPKQHKHPLTIPSFGSCRHKPESYK